MSAVAKVLDGQMKHWVNYEFKNSIKLFLSVFFLAFRVNYMFKLTANTEDMDSFLITRLNGHGCWLVQFPCSICVAVDDAACRGLISPLKACFTI